VLRRHPLPPAPRRRPPLPAHAVVIGAGLGGLAAAQALARHVERVTVIERDDLPDRPGPRPGVPQSRHVHALQPGGLVALERLLPGCAAEMRAAGAVALRVPEDLCWLAAGGWMPPVPARDGRTILSASRDLIEWTVRRRVLESPQVLVRSGLEVCGLAVDRGRTTGVQVRSRRAGTAGPVVTICADLVVDAGGRRSPAPEWFAAAGIDPPAETVIDSGLAYASRIYRRTDGDAGERKAILLQGQPPERPRTGLAMPIERGRWMVTVSSAGGDVPPTDEAGFLAFARSLRSSEVADLLSRAEPLGPVAAYRRTQNRRLRYEDLARPMEGFLATGDALCSFNPVYAQGMSTAAMAAAALDEALDAHLVTRRDLAGFTAGAQRALAATCEGAWKVATGVDLRFPTVRGDARGRRARAVDNLMGRYMARVGRAATVDPAVTYALYDVIALLAPPQSLFRPAVARRVLVRRQAPGTPRARRVGGLAAEPAAMTPT
jgi:2-polyprenyl-6-methoxyphenol hydroxylase-like FAD-dependent oxidoreductase